MILFNQQPDRRLPALRMLWIVALMILVGSFSLFSPSSTQAQDAIQIGSQSYDFRIIAANQELVADGISETTLIAFLSSAEGSSLNDERIRFTLQDGHAFLNAPSAGRGFSTSSGSSRVFSTNDDDLILAVDGINIGNGIYAARLRSSDTAGSVTIAAEWTNAPLDEVPRASTTIRLIAAEELMVRVDNPTILAEGEEEATIIAYVLDGLGRPVRDANVTFRLLDGAGTLDVVDNRNRSFGGRDVIVDGEAGRYAAIFRPANTPGQAVIEVSLPTITEPISETVMIEVVDASSLEATIFPEQVSRDTNNRSNSVNTATILVAVRDGDGDLVSGLRNNDLQAQIIRGPGEVDGPTEIRLDGRNDSGVYQFTFEADNTTGESIIQITNLNVPSRPSTEVTVNTVSQLQAGVVDEIRLVTFADEPFFANDENRALVVAFLADSDGNAPNPDLDIDVEFDLVQGQGEIEERADELRTRGSINESGIFITTFTVGNVKRDSSARIRALATTDDNRVITETAMIAVQALQAPEVVVFPSSIPSARESRVVIDIFDINNQDSDDFNFNRDRYEVDIISGPGDIRRTPSNRGNSPDLVSDDNISSTLLEVDEDVAAASQDIIFNVIDESIVGFQLTEGMLTIGEETNLRAFAAPNTVEPGTEFQIMAVATDAFGFPVIEHNLRMTVISGSATLIDGGEMVDDGGRVGGRIGGRLGDMEDAFRDDGVYVGVVRAAGVADENIRLRITDLTAPSQPSVDIEVNVDTREASE